MQLDITPEKPHTGFSSLSVYTVGNDKVQLSKAIYRYEKDESIKRFFLAFENKEIILPNKFLPNQSFFQYHRENIFIK